ncbi:MAG: YdcF family protein [Clostridiales Family XIII bacterium]|jgi:vancomycin permeability regulator SanA|nr:YdcF family protein [Clostridiales Family XIII bacterium]
MANNRQKKPKRTDHFVLRAFFKFVIVCVVVVLAFIGVTNVIMVASTQDRIVSAEEVAAVAEREGKFPCAEVLGASVLGVEPSPILASRINVGMEAVKDGATDILLFSGDNGTNEYNEVAAMKKYATENGGPYGVSGDNIYLDYAGFSTYDSMYRLRDVFGTKRAIIVTQQYHLYRALYIAHRLGIDAYGVAAETRESGQLQREIREIFARTKDFFYILANRQPKFLGDPIDLVYPADQPAGQ